MQAKRRIGLIMPPRNPSERVVSGSGIVDAATVDELTSLLQKAPGVDAVVPLSLGSAFVDGWKVYDAGRVGGNADYVDVSASPVAALAEKAARALGCDIVGLDFIYSARTNSYLIVDENTLPGMYADCFAAAGTGSLAAHLARMVLGNTGNKARAA